MPYYPRLQVIESEYSIIHVGLIDKIRSYMNLIQTGFYGQISPSNREHRCSLLSG